MASQRWTFACLISVKEIRISTMYLLLLFSLYFTKTLAIYEDQVNAFDWRKQFIGNVKFAHFEQVSLSSRRLLLATESSVLTSINARTGDIVWRRVFEKYNGKINNLIHQGSTLITISSNGALIRSWEPSKGHLIWEKPLAIDNKKPQQQSENVKSELLHQSFLVKNGKGSNTVLLVLTNYFVAAISTNNGQQLWMKNAVTGSSFFRMQSDESVVRIISMKSNGQADMMTCDLVTGESKETKTAPASHGVAKGLDSCVVVGSVVLCVEEETKMIHVGTLVDSQFYFVANHLALVLRKPNLGEGTWKFETLGDSSNHDLVGLSHSTGIKYLLRIKGTNLKVEKQFNLCQCLLLTRVAKRSIIAAVQLATNDSTMIKLYDADTIDEIVELRQSFQLYKSHGNAIKGALYAFAKRDEEIGYRVLLSMEDHTVLLLQQTGKVVWEREEALADILTTEMIDLPSIASESKLELLHEEFRSVEHGGILTKFVKRIQIQIKQLEVLIANLKKRRHFGEQAADMRSPSEELGRDQFNMRKMIVAATAAGKIFGIDSAGGNIVWSQFVPNLKPFSQKGLLLFIQRTTAHFPFQPQCLVIGQNKNKKKTVLFAFNPINGVPLKNEPDLLPFSITQGSLLPFTDEKFLKVVLLTDKDNQIHIYPETDKTLHDFFHKLSSLYSYKINDKTGGIQGYSLTSAKEEEIGSIRCSEVWRVKIPSEQEIINVVTPRHDEHVHSVGRVLGDRSVLYKYLNPNLVAIATVHPDRPKSSVYIYLIDGVTGHIVYQARHKNAEGPVRMIVSEHWMTYVYVNIKARRTEMAVVELYEGFEEKNSTAFSSLDSWPKPLALSQGYVLPVGNVNALGVTNTERGITHKNILLALDSGHVYSLPKNLLDPRRTFDPKPTDAEEGLMPYMPELPIVPVAYLNYNMTIEDIRGIHTAAAGLESTSLVLAYGLDLYFTRVTPSKMFDVLKEDFDYIFISGVLSALILATIISSKLASIKQLKLAWK